MFVFLTIGGGVALILFGIRNLRRGLDRLFGQRLGPWINRVAGRPLTAFGSGLGLALIAPSSTTMSLLAVQTVQTGHVGLRQMLAVLLGANIGLTIMVQIIALDITGLVPLLILVGVILFQFVRRSRARGIGQVLLSLGLILMGMDMIGRAVAAADLARNPDFVQLLDIADNHPWLLLIIAGLLAVSLQSSTATLGLLIGLSGAGILSLPLVVPFVLGTNIGLSVTTMIAGWRRVESRRLAAGNMSLKLLVALPLLIGIAIFGGDLSARFRTVSPSVVAAIHSGFNVLVALVGLSTLGVVTALVRYVVPDPPLGAVNRGGPRFISSGPIAGTAMAMGQSLLEINHMAEIVRSMLADVWVAFKTGDKPLAREVGERDDEVDELYDAIKRYLSQLARDEISETEADEQMRQLRYLTEMETIGDIIDKNIVELSLKTIRIGAKFSAAGAEELDDFHAKILENFDIAVVAFTRRDHKLAQKLLRHKERLKSYGRELRDRHFERLTAGERDSYESSAIHLDLLTHLDRINSALTHVAYALLDDAGRVRGTH